MIYGEAAQEYWDKGWRGILPLPPRMKKWPPSGYTGHGAEDPSFADIIAWTEDKPDGNLALHLPHNVIGLDVDAYGAKTGEATFIEALNRWGALPPTVRTTSRRDGVSGIRLYRIPPEVQLRSEIKFPEQNVANIEIIQFSHRYAVSWPSIHPDTGDTYVWLDESGNQVGIPRIEDLPMLPQRWLDGLRVEQITKLDGTHVNPFETLKGFLPGPMSETVSNALRDAKRHLDTDPGSRHDACMRDVLYFIRLGEQRETGVPEALNELGRAFAEATRDRNTASEAAGEFARMVYGQRGHDLIAATPSTSLEELAPDARRLEPQFSDKEERTFGLSPDETRDLMTQGYETEFVEGDDSDWSFMGGDDIHFESDDSVNSFLMGTVSQTALAEEQSTKPLEESPKTMRDRLLSISGLANIKPALPMVDKLLYQGTLAQIAGDPGSFKTFLTLGLACAVASNLRSWETYQVQKHGPVIYVAAEGVSGVRARILAWCEDNNQDPDSLNLHLYPEPIQLGSYNQVEELTQLACDIGAVLVVFDTRARCTSDLNENDATEQDVAIRHAEKIRMASGATVLMIHHSARSGTAGRGSNAWDGAVWSDMRLSASGNSVTVTCEKHKDAESHCKHEFAMKPHTVSADMMPDTEEEVRKTLVIVAKETLPADSVNDSGLIERVLDLLKEADLADGRSPKGILKDLEMEENQERTLRRTLHVLEERGSIKNVGSEKMIKYRINQ